MNREPSVTSDPRFRAGRTLVRTGGEGAIGMFATLVEESRSKYGDASIEAASCYYEYGNALLRVAQRKDDDNDQDDDEKDVKPEATKSSSSAAAADAAERRRRREELSFNNTTAADDEKKNNVASTKEDSDATTTTESKVLKNDNNNNGCCLSNEDEDDMKLALEMMENSWAIIDDYVKNNQQQPKTESTKTNNNENNDNNKSLSCLAQWAREQLPRILIGIGDLHSFSKRHADAVDAYTRAIPFRESLLDDDSDRDENKTTTPTVDDLKRRRLIVEVNVLVAEELLKCDGGEDVVTERGDVLVEASERVDFARGYYDRARDGLQETVYLMGRLAGSGKDLGTEKEDVCFLATMLMNIGNILADLDEEAKNEASGAKETTRKAKKLKKEET